MKKTKSQTSHPQPATHPVPNRNKKQETDFMNELAKARDVDVTFQLNPAVYHELKICALAEGCTVGDFINGAIEGHIGSCYEALAHNQACDAAYREKLKKAGSAGNSAKTNRDGWTASLP